MFPVAFLPLKYKKVFLYDVFLGVNFLIYYTSYTNYNTSKENLFLELINYGNMEM